MAMEYGLKHMPIPASHFHRMQAEGALVQTAKDYEATIREVLKNHTFDLIMLGMGDDGHTASLFPQTLALMIEDLWIAPNHIPQKDTWRMTMTYPCINAARHIAIYVIGGSKSAMLKQVLQGPYDPITLPSQKVGTSSHKALWIADSAAAQSLNAKV
jgi:6-phosphogluconolactonase